MGIRKISLIILFFVFFSSLISSVFCGAKEDFAGGTDQDSYLNGPDQSHRGFPSADEDHCSGQNHLCCYSAVNVTQAFFFVPDVYPRLSFEIRLQPFEITKNFYHPPQNPS